MKDIFRFIISDKVKLYKDNQINIEVELIGNNVKFYLKELEKLRTIYEKLENPILKHADILNKGKFHKNTDKLDIALCDIQKTFDRINRMLWNLFLEKSDTLIKDYERFIDDLDKSRDIYFKDALSKVENYYQELWNLIDSKISMCSRLNQLENKPLTALVTFEKDGFSTHFTKYHLSLESFSEQLHSILQEEFDKKYMHSYRKIENTHFNLLDSKEDNNLITVDGFLKFSDSVMNNYSEIKKYPENFLKAQKENYTIELDIEGMLTLYSQIEDKFNEVYETLSSNLIKKKKGERYINIIFLRVLSLMYKFKLKDLIFYNTKNLDKLIEFVETKDNLEKEINHLSLGNLFRVEASLADKVFKSVLLEMKNKDDFYFHDTTNKFMIRKADRNLFDNNQFYTHQMMIYEMVPQELNFRNNKYMQNSGYDKVFFNENLHRQTSKVYSQLLNKKISYEFYLKTAIYFVNVNNYQKKA